MITNVYTRPKIYNPSNAPIMWTVLSDKITEVGMKYVFDVYVEGTVNKITSIYQNPNPSGYGVIDIQKIVQPYIESYKHLHEVTPTTIFKSGDLYKKFKVLVGEYYYDGVGDINSAQSYTIYPGTSDNAGLPSYLLSYNDSTTNYIVVYGGAMSLLETKDHYDSTSAEGIIDDNMMVYTLNANSGKFLTQSPLLTKRLRWTDEDTLTFLNRYYNALNIYSSPFKVVFKFYKANGTQITYNSAYGSPITLTPDSISGNGNPLQVYWLNDSTNGGIIKSAGIPNYSNLDKELLSVICGPKYIGLTKTNLNLTDFSYYTVEMQNNASVRISDIHKFYVYEDEAGMYPSIRFSWLNKMAGRDYFNFDMYYELNHSVSSKSFYRDQINTSDSSMVINTTTAGNLTYNKVITKSIRVESDWLTEEQFEHVRGMLLSPHLLVYLPNTTTPQLCTIKENSYMETKQYGSNRLKNIAFTIDLSIGDRVQNL